MPTDLDGLQGTWHVTSVEHDGERMPAAFIAEARVTLDGNRFTSLGMGAPYAGTVVVDESCEPKSLDLLITEGHAAGTRNLGIYQLAGDRWTICLATRGSQRPVRFVSPPASGIALETLERGASPRAASRGKRKRAAPADVTPMGPATVLEGEWAMVAAVFDGAAMAEETVRWCKRVTRGDVTTVTAGQQVMLRARFSLDDGATPYAIDYVHLAGSNVGTSQAGIAELRGELLRICSAAPGSPRPTDFSSVKGDGRSFTTWRKVSP